jgi:predicted metal-dependent RNase
MKRGPEGHKTEPDEVVIRPLGAGQEVGRSCFVLRYQGKGVMFDCGIHPAYSGKFFPILCLGHVFLVTALVGPLTTSFPEATAIWEGTEIES